MAKDLVLDVVARKNSKELTVLAAEFDALAKKTDESGKSLQKHTTFAKFLEDQLEKTKTQVRELGEEFDRTGNKDVFAKLKSSQANLKSLENIGKQLSKSLTAELEQGGEEGVQGFMDALIKAWPVTLPLAALLGTELVAAIGGGILAGVGGGALATGIVLQLQNPTVKSAVTDLGSFIKGELTSATDVFQGPLLAGINEFKQGLDLSGLRDAFKQIAPYAELFGRELGQAAQTFLPQFSHALKEAGPVLGVVARELPTLAKGLGDFFEQIGEGSKGGAEALDTFIKAVALGLSGLGYVIHGAEVAFEGLVTAADQFTGVAVGILGWVPIAGDKLNQYHNYIHGIATSYDDAKISSAGFAGATAGNSDSVAKAMEDATKAAEDYNTSLEKLFKTTLTADQATIKQKQSIQDLTDSISKNGKNWDINTEAGRKNSDALLAAIDAAEKKREADIAAGKDAVSAAEDYNKEVDQLLGIAQKGGDAKAALDALKGKYEIDIDEVHRYQFISEGTPPANFFHGLAGGGDVEAKKPYLVGEKGPELFVSDTPGQIIPNDQLKGFAAPPPPYRAPASASSSAGAVVGLEVVGGADSAVGTLINGLLRVGALRLTVRNGVVVAG